MVMSGPAASLSSALLVLALTGLQSHTKTTTDGQEKKPRQKQAQSVEKSKFGCDDGSWSDLFRGGLSQGPDVFFADALNL
jgi:hypothetical protein